MRASQVIPQLLLLLLSLCLCGGRLQQNTHRVTGDWATLRGKAEKACLKDRYFSDKSLDSACTLFVVHNHKAGATSLCSVAAESGFRVPQPLGDCLGPEDIQSRGKEGAMADYIEENHLQFLAHDMASFFPLTASSSRIIYSTVVRNPWDRILSSVHHELCGDTLESGRAIANRYQCKFDVLTATAADIVLDPCFRTSFTSVNYYINKFSPCPTSSTAGTPQCEKKNLLEAQRLLELMSAIFVTDDAESCRHSFSVMTRIAPHLRYNPHLCSDPMDAKFLLRKNLSAWNALVYLNQEDYLFYRHALRMAEFQQKTLRNSNSVRREPVRRVYPTVYKVVDDKPFFVHNPEHIDSEGTTNTSYPSSFCSFTVSE